MRNNNIDPIKLTNLKRTILFPVFFLSVAFFVFSFSSTVAWAAAPPTPINLTATAASSNQINLSWKDNATTETNYYVEHSPNGSSSWTVIATLGSNVTSYQNTGLTQNTTHYYRVRCKAGNTYSSYSNTANAKTATLAAPTALAATVASASQINLSWTDNTTYEKNYSVERSPNGSSSWTVIATLGANVITYTNTGRSVSTTYYYRVRAYDGTNYSAYSSVVNQTIRTIVSSAGANGAISPSGTIAVANRSTKAFTMTPNTGYKIASVKVDGSAVAANSTFTFSNITANHTISATFSVNTFTITASAGANGTISPVGVVAVNEGASRTFALTSNSGYHVSNVLVDGVSVGVVSTYTFTNVTVNHTITARFAINTYTITASTGANGTISPAGIVIINSGATTTFTITPTTEYHVADVLVDGASVGAVSTYTFSNVTVSHTITASFAVSDTTPPTGSIVINNGAAFTKTTNVPLTLSATDSGSGVSQMQFSNDGSTWSTPEAYASLKSWTTTTGDGAKTVYAKFKDKANNWSNAIPSNTIDLDTTPPLVTMTSPAAGFNNNKTPLLSYAVSDGTVVVKLDGVVISKVSGNNLDALLDGQHTIRVESTDAVNNVGFTEVTFTLDTVAPAITITSPTAGYINNKTPLLSYTISDGTTVVKVDGTVISKVSGTNLDALPDGPHTVIVESTDAANNIGHAEVNFTVDTTAPVVTVTSPVAGSTNNNAPLLSYTVSDGAVVVKVDGVVVSKVSGNNLDALPDGQHTIRIESTDAPNNIGFAEVNITVDTIAPIVSIASPAPGPMNNRTPLLTYAVSEGTVVVIVDGNIVTKVSGTTLDPLANGPHTVRVESTDTAGNMGFAEVTFTITIADTTPPTTSISTNPSSPDGANGWFKTVPTITLTSNESGTTLYRWGTDQYLSTRQKQEWTSGGEHLNILGDDVGAWYTLPFSFTFYGAEYSRVFLSSNGLMSFDSENADPYDAAGLAGRLAIAPLWDDLRTDTRQDDDIYVFQPDSDSVGFRWQAVTYADNKDVNIEIILHRDGRIRFNYAKQSGSLYGTIGISKGDGINHSIAYDGDIFSTNNIDSIVFAPISWTVSTNPFTAMSGENTLYYYSKDSSGNVEATKNQSFKVDATMPVVTIASPLAGFTNNTTPVLSYTLSKVTSTNTVMVDGTAVNKTSGDTLGPLSEGPHTVRVDVVDYAGHATYAEVTFIVVSFAPSVSIVSPTAGATNNNTPLLSYTVNYGTVTVKVDGAVVNKASGDNLDMLADGPHTVRVEATDASGYTTYSEVDFKVDITPPLNSSMMNFIKIDAGDSHSAAITSDGNMWWWGYMIEFGYRNAVMPRAIGAAHVWTAISSGFEGSLALRSDGSLWGWGGNPYINISNYHEFTPGRISAEADWTAISAKGVFGLGATMLKNDGTLWGLGRRQTLRQIGSDANWVAVSNGEEHIVALKSDGTLWAWGNNEYGQVGLPGDVSATPTQISSDTNWSTISAGVYHTVALMFDGTLWAWGNNEYGQVGNGDESGASQDTPIRIGSDTNWSAISAGGYHTVALKSDGSLWAWGNNECDPYGGGQLGDGSQVNRYTPVQIGSDTNWSAISAGECHTLALKTDGSLWTWGVNWGNETDVYGYYHEGWTSPHNIFSTDDAILISNGSTTTSATAVTLTLNAWDVTSGVAFMKFSNDGTTWSSPEPYATTKDWMLGSKNGTKTVYAMFQDAAGNWSVVYSASILLIAGPTEVAITSPIAGFTRSNKPLISFTINKGDTMNTVKVDNVVVNKVSGDTLDALTDGSHLLQVEAVDANGYADSAEVSFTVDSVVPSVTITAPVAGITNTHKPILSYTVTEGNVVVKVDGVIVNKISGNALDPLANGDHIVRVEATDTAGNVGVSVVAFTVESLAPTVVITSPAFGITNNKTPTLTYMVSEGTVVVKVDGAVVNKISGDRLTALSDGSHIVRVEATNTSNYTDYAEVTFTVDTIAPIVTISSPVAGVTNLDTLPLIYSVSDGAVTVKLDGSTVNMVSGEDLDALLNGDHTVRVEARDTANNLGFAEVTFTVDTSSAGNDDTNIYCMGTGTYLVDPSSFTSGIPVPTIGNAVLIASPYNGATITGSKTIIKGAMDTTIPVMGVVIQLINSSGTATYPVSINGKYFAAQIPLAPDSNTINVIATDQNNVQHQASVTVTGMLQSNNVELYASPNAGIPTLKPNGQTLRDVALFTTTAISKPVKSYTWNFNGSGANDLTCYSHSNVTASYQQTGLYLTAVTVTDMAGNHFTDAVIVNVVDRNVMETLLTAKWAGMKAAVISGNIVDAMSYFVSGTRDRYNAIFTNPSRNIAARLSEITRIEIYSVQDVAADCVAIRQESDGEYAYPLTFIIDENGMWKILGF